MDFALSDEQELFVDSLRELLEREFDEKEFEKCYSNHTPYWHLEEALYESGFGLLGVPEEFGGTPVDLLTKTLAYEEIGRICGYNPDMTANALLIELIFAFGTKEQQQFAMDYLAEHKRPMACLGSTEPQAGSDNNAIACTATRKDDKIIINGTKSMITGCYDYPYIIIVTRDFETGLPANKSMSMWLVDLSLPGVSMSPLSKVGMWNKSCGDVYFDNVEIDESCRLGQEGKGFYQLMKGFEAERILLAANSMGMAQGAFEDAARYANQRECFGQTISNFQLIQEKLTYMQIKLMNMRNIVRQTAWEHDQGIDVRTSSALTKLYCVKTAFEVIDDAMQIFGGVGYFTDNRVARMWSEIRANQIGGGANEVMIYVAGRGIAKEHAC